MKREKRPHDKNGTEEKQLTFLKCPKHGTTYPKGGSCPRCAAEKNSDN